MIDLIYFLLIGIVAGFLAGWILKGKGFGWIINLILGMAGSFVGSKLLWIIGITGTGFIGRVIVASIGALVLIFLVNLIFGKKS